MTMSLYITPTGSGDGSGSNWDNAARIDQISNLIAAAGPGGKILVRADQGSYRLTSAISITAGGNAGAPVTITGVDGDGKPMKAEIVGARDTTWQPGDASGSEVFRLLEGADHLAFDQFSFRDIGNGAFRVGAPITDLTLGNMRAENVQRFFDNLVSSGRTDASITGLNIHDVTVAGYSKGAIRVQYNSSAVVIQDVLGDSEHVDGDNFAVGVALTGTAHDILFKRVEMSNARDTTNAYRNGDGFVTELGNYNITYDSVVASGNTDGGLDLKSQATNLSNIIVLDNKHNLRLWSFSVNLTNVLSGSTNLHGTEELPGDVLVERGATDFFRDSFFYETNPTYPIFDLRAGNLLLKLQDVYYAGATFSVAIGGSVVQTLPGTGNTNYVAGTLSGDVMVGTAGRDILYGDRGDDLISSGAGNDQLVGGDGADLLDGGTGNDLMTGGSGDDTYVVDSIDDLTAEVEGGGTDLVLTSLSAYTLRVYTENLTFTGTGGFAGTGNNLDNVITGGDSGDVLIGYGGNDVLIGGHGADRMVGGRGDDTYEVDAAGDVVVEQAGEGYDTVLTSLATYALTDGVEALTATGTDDFTGVGNALDNVVTAGNGNDTLSGGIGNDVLNGGGGRDVLIGGAGDDVYLVDNPNDAVVEGLDEGIDTVRVSYATATLGENVENLAFIGTDPFFGFGNGLDNILTGGIGNDSLTGGGGNDILGGGGGSDLLVGGVGDDIYEVDATGDTVVELSGEGSDTVRTSLNTYLLGDQLEGLSFIGKGNFTGTGNALANVITAGSGDDVLDGGAGADVLSGGGGKDTYVVDDAGDIVIESAGGGSDTVRTTLNSYVMSDNVEALVFTGTGDFVGTGNGLADAISGGAGNDLLIGGAGDDRLDGGAGDDQLDGGADNDTYLVDSVGDSIVEAADGGIDSVRTTLNGYVLDAALENLAFTGTGGFAGTGHDAANRLVGGAGNDTLIGLGGNDVLDGGAGEDRLEGGGGDDTFLVDSAGDVIVEAAGEGNDTVVTTLNAYALGDDLERLVFAGGGAFSGMGNALANDITGGGGNDLIDGGLGDDRLAGGTGDDVYVVDSASDVVVEAQAGGIDTVRTSVASYQLSDNVEGLIFTGTGSFSGSGNALGNTLTGGASADVLDGGIGADVLDGGAGDDLLIGGTGDDIYLIDSTSDVIVEKDIEGDDLARVTAAAYTLSEHVEALAFVGVGDFTGSGNDENNRLSGGSGNDVLRGLGGNDVLVGGSGADEMIGGGGDDTYSVDSAGDIVTENADEGTDTVTTSLSAYALGSDVERLTFTGTGAFQGTGNGLDNVITAGAGNDTLIGGGGNDRLAGGAGADRMTGGTGGDVYVVDNVGDIVTELVGEGSDTVTTTLGSYTLAANLEDLLYAGVANFFGTGNAAANMIVGGNGNDTLIGLGGGDRLDGGAGTDMINYTGSGGGVVIDLLLGTGKGGDAEGDVLVGIENVYGSWVNDVLIGNDAANVLLGFRGSDTLYGGGGNDSLDGQYGVDIAYGGTGDDIYSLDDLNDQAIEYAGEGNDTVQMWLNRYTLAANIENLTFIGSGAFTGTGNELANSITGGSGADYLAGMAGKDTLDGGAGPATDVLDGGADDDVLEGRGGADTLIGGTGSDTAAYAYSAVGVTVNLTTGVGAGGDAQGDRFSEIENLLGSRFGDTLTGDINANVIAGGYGNDVIDGGGGVADTLVGGTGDDTYYVTGGDAVIVELSRQGIDQVFTTLNSFMLPSEVEDASFIGTGDFVGVGNAYGNVLRGGAGNDTLIGGAGGDVMIGGAGDDIYDVDNSSDLLLELTNEGNDTVRTTRSYYTLGVNVENLVFTGTYVGSATFSGTGNGLANLIVGSYQTDYLDGREGADTLVGGLGDDVYLVDNQDDAIIEAAGAGNDTVRATNTSFTLAENVERLIQIGNSDFTGRGNDLDNLITTNYGNDIVYGYGGNDTILSGFGNDAMYGGTGDDTYRVESAGDTVIEYDGEGTDLIRVALASYVAPDNVENLTFNGVGGFSAMGNALANVLTGGKNADLLDGGAGADTLVGGLGNDTYVVDDSGDIIVEGSDGGIDTIRTTLATYALGSNVEGLIYTGTAQFGGTGNTLANTIVGGSGNDLLDGGLGADTLTGGAGDDTYVVDEGDDVIVEAADGGLDTVRAAAAAYVLGANLEALIYTGTGNFAGTGNDGSNAIVGGAGNDILDGGAGADTLTGGSGNDIYVVDGATDIIVEQDGGGSDTVRTALGAYVLGSNLEALAFTGSGVFTGTGNALANVLTGGAGNDVLDGGGGNDRLDGGAGADRLIGGTGDDLFVVADAGDVVVELASGGTDTVRTTLASYTLAANVEVLSFDGVAGFTGSGNAIDNIITGGDAGDMLMGLVGQDTLYGGIGNDVLNGGYGLDVLYGGSGDDTLIGESHLDMLYGDAGNDTIIGDFALISSAGYGANDPAWGGDGDDTIYGDGVTMTGGFAGKDYLYGGNGDDTIFGDADTITGGSLGNDAVSGDAGNDWVYGDGRFISAGVIGGNDYVNGGAGDDHLFGGGGNDNFVFDAKGSGNDVIGDFGQVAGNRDTISLSGLRLKFADLHISLRDGDTIIETPFHDTITLLGVASVTSADFFF